jgi:hypothetical protein
MLQSQVKKYFLQCAASAATLRALKTSDHLVTLHRANREGLQAHLVVVIGLLQFRTLPLCTCLGLFVFAQCTNIREEVNYTKIFKFSLWNFIQICVAQQECCLGLSSGDDIGCLALTVIANARQCERVRLRGHRAAVVTFPGEE